MAQHGGARNGAGRKSKSDEVALIESLSPLDIIAFQKLEAGIKAGDFQFIKLFFEYRHGKPKQALEHSGEVNFTWEEIATYETDSQTN